MAAAEPDFEDEELADSEELAHEGKSNEVRFVDAATRVSTPSAFDTWYYGIEDKLGQGTVGMGVCLILFILILLIAIFVNPI